MNRIGKRIGFLMMAALAVVGAHPAKADAVTDWNAIMQTTVAAGNANIQARSAAIVQVAVFEAVNAVVGDYEPYLGIPAPPWASADAAAIAAAHRTLVTLYPGSAATLDAERTASLAAIMDGPAKDAGIEAGETAAAALLLLRANDGWNANLPYTPGTNPGDWQPAPPALAPASQPWWGQMTPFGLRSGSQFRSAPPPPIYSGRYATDYREVKHLGKSDASSEVRPQDRTDVARFFAVTSPTHAWNLVARQVSAVQGKTLSENARIFALLQMAICDASIAVYDTKYYYNIWRPLTAIWGGGVDGNPGTAPDGTWFPLITTPPFPSYPSGHATLSGSARVVLERLFGEHGHAITLTSPRMPGLVLNYTAFKQICSDIDDARIYGGIHFRFDQEVGALQGRMVGNWILQHHLRAAHGDD